MRRRFDCSRRNVWKYTLFGTVTLRRIVSGGVIPWRRQSAAAAADVLPMLVWECCCCCCETYSSSLSSSYRLSNPSIDILLYYIIFYRPTGLLVMEWNKRKDTYTYSYSYSYYDCEWVVCERRWNEMAVGMLDIVLRIWHVKEYEVKNEAIAIINHQSFVSLKNKASPAVLRT